MAFDPVAQPALRRSLGFTLLVLYGLGTTVGGGIYVLIGRVAERAGLYAPVSFLVAALLVAFTALTFAELSSRYPESAGEAVYVQRGFGRRELSLLVGVMVILAGLFSSAALAHGFAGYLRAFVDVPAWIAVIAIVLAIGALAAWGIGESVGIAAIVTLIEVGGLLVIIWAGSDSLAEFPARWRTLVPPLDIAPWIGIVAGSYLAFYAFIGFEDMVNVAEEVKDAPRILPRAIVVTLVVTTIIYILVALVAVMGVPLAQLATSEAPLVLIAERRLENAGWIFGFIGMLAVLNGALIQLIMAARVLYGMAREGWIHSIFGRVHARTQTPLPATAAGTAAIVILALAFPIDVLAEATSMMVLSIAALVNAALVRLKLTHRVAGGSLDLPLWVPAVGLGVSFVFALLILANLIG